MVPGLHERALEGAAGHHLDGRRHAELALDQAHAAPRLAVDVAAPAGQVAAAGAADVALAGVALEEELILGPLLGAEFLLAQHGPLQHVAALWVHGDGHVLVHPARAEQVARIAQVRLHGHRVPEHIAPVLVLVIDDVLGGVVAHARVHPAHAHLHGVLKGARAVEGGAVHVADVLEHLGLHVGQLHVVLGTRQHAPVHARTPLRANEPVAHHGHLVEHQRHLAALLQHGRVGRVPLVAVVVVGVDGHLQAVLGLDLALAVVPAQELAQGLASLCLVQRVGGPVLLPVQVKLQRHIVQDALAHARAAVEAGLRLGHIPPPRQGWSEPRPRFPGRWT